MPPPVLLIYCSNAAQMGSFWTPLRPLFSCFFRVTRPVRGLQKTHGKSREWTPKWPKVLKMAKLATTSILMVLYTTRIKMIMCSGRKTTTAFLTKKNHFFRTKKSDFEWIPVHSSVRELTSDHMLWLEVKTENSSKKRHF